MTRTWKARDELGTERMDPISINYDPTTKPSGPPPTRRQMFRSRLKRRGLWAALRGLIRP